MNTRPQNNPEYSSRIALDVMGIQDRAQQTYTPYHGPYSYSKIKQPQIQTIPQRVDLFQKSRPYQQYKVSAPHSETELHQNAKSKELVEKLRTALKKIQMFIFQSEEQLTNIRKALGKESWSQSIKLNRLIYLEKFQKDYQMLILDLKSKAEFLDILIARAANVQEHSSIQNWLLIINVKYVEELEKQLNFLEWKEFLDKPESPVFVSVINNGKKDADLMKRIVEKQNEKEQVRESQRASQSEFDTSHPSHPNRDSLGFSLVELDLSGSFEKSNSNSNNNNNTNNNVLNPIQILKTSANNRNSHPENFVTGSLESTLKQNSIGSLLSSEDIRNSDTGYVMEYSDAQTLKTQSFRRWVEQNCGKESLNSSVSDEFEPIVVTPYTLAGSYHPMTQSQNSHNLNTSSMERSSVRSVRM